LDAEAPAPPSRRTAKSYASKGVSARDLMALTKNKIPYAPWFERYLDHRLAAERAREADRRERPPAGGSAAEGVRLAA
jgi:hypothetical protein